MSVAAKRVAAAVMLGAALHAEDATAFDYPEHAHLSHDGIKIALADNPATQRVLESAIHALNAGSLCQRDRLLSEAPEGCFALSDIPALSGDHAASPMLVKWRWFNDCLAPEHPEGALSKLGRIVSGLDRFPQSPEMALLTPPRVEAMLRLTRGYAPRHWPLATPPSDLDFLDVDDGYVTLSERGKPHFRPALSAPSLELAQERLNKADKGKPKDHAFAWYADLHTGAKMFARHAAQSADPEFYLGAAVLLELTSLHYLEDSVAPGHMVPEQWMNNGSRSATHDRYSVFGVAAKPSEQLCAFAGRHPGSLPVLAQACIDGRRTVRLFGDHQLSRRDVNVPSASHDWAAAVVAKSILEVVEASLENDTGRPEQDALAHCAASLAEPSYSWDQDHGACGGADQNLYRCMYRWWQQPAWPSTHAPLIGIEFGDGGKPIALRNETALQMLPVPLVDGEPVAGDDQSEDEATLKKRERAFKIYPRIVTYSGTGTDAQHLWSASLDSGRLQPGAHLGWRLVAPIFPLEVGLGGEVFWRPSDCDLRSADGVLDIRYRLTSDRPHIFVTANLRVGAATAADGRMKAHAGGAGGAGWYIVSQTYLEWSLFATIGGAGVTGPLVTAGTGVSF